jgi:hypothetical protein
MTTMRRLFSLVAVAALGLGCRSGDDKAVLASLPGSYVYAAKGSALSKPWEVYVRLDLTPDNRYTFTMDKKIEGKTDPTEHNVGTYTVSGDHLTLYEEAALVGQPRDMHKFVIKADSLVAEVGWTAQLFIKGVGAPNIVFVKQRRS